MTREEELWAAIVAALNNENYAGELPAAPSWRSEEFLMGILAGIKGVSDAKVPEPVWNDEKYLAAIFDQVNGGVVNCKLLASREFDVNTSSTSESSVGTVPISKGLWTKDFIIYVKIRDKAGKRNGYFRGSDAFVINNYAANGTSSNPTPVKVCDGYDAGGKFVQTTSGYGVYLSSVAKSTNSDGGSLLIKARYSSSYGTINGTFLVEVYALSWPNNDGMFK